MGAGLALQGGWRAARVLLDHVHQLVSEQAATGILIGPILTVAEHHVTPNGKGQRVDVTRGSGGMRVGVDPHVVEVVAEARLEEATDRAESGRPPSSDLAEGTKLSPTDPNRLAPMGGTAFCPKLLDQGAWSAIADVGAETAPSDTWGTFRRRRRHAVAAAQAYASPVRRRGLLPAHIRLPAWRSSISPLSLLLQKDVWESG